MVELEGRVSALEQRHERVLQLLHQAAESISTQRERIGELEGRLKAHTLVTTAVLQLAHRSDPEGYTTILTLMDRTERDLLRAQEDEATVRELREMLGVLRATTREDPV